MIGCGGVVIITPSVNLWDTLLCVLLPIAFGLPWARTRAHLMAMRMKLAIVKRVILINWVNSMTIDRALLPAMCLVLVSLHRHNLAHWIMVALGSLSHEDHAYASNSYFNPNLCWSGAFQALCCNSAITIQHVFNANSPVPKDSIPSISPCGYSRKRYTTASPLPYKLSVAITPLCRGRRLIVRQLLSA